MAEVAGRARPIRIASAITGLIVAVSLGWYTLSIDDLKVLFSSWAVPAATALYLVQQAGCGFAWHTLLEPPRPSRRDFFLIRWIRASIAGLLPVGGLGAALAAVRLATMAGLRIDTAGASLTLDATVEMVTQVAFTIAGLILLFASSTEPRILEWSTVGLVLVALTAMFIGAQRAGGMKLVESGFSRFADRWPRLSPITEARLHDELMRLHARRKPIFIAGLFHFNSWLLTAGETWVVLFAIGHLVSPAKCIVLESLSTAARSIGFFVPGAFGVQEIALVGGGALVGLTPETALLIAVVKRLRDIVIGVPGLLLWQWIEGHRFLIRRYEQPSEMRNRRGSHPIAHTSFLRAPISYWNPEIRHDSITASPPPSPERLVLAQHCSAKAGTATVVEQGNTEPATLESSIKSRQRYDAMLRWTRHPPAHSGLRLAIDRVLGTFIVMLWIVQTLLRR